MKAERILEALRPVVLVVDGLGHTRAVHGGFGGFLGYPTAELVGRSVFDIVRPEEVGDLATHFIESGGQSDRDVSLSLPFRVTIVAPDGAEHAVDVIPSGVREPDADEMIWVVALVPVSMNTALSRALDAEMARRPRWEVRTALAEELVVDNDSYISRWFLVDLSESGAVTVTTSRTEAEDMAVELRRQVVDEGWSPWTGIEPRSTVAIDLAGLPASMARRCAAMNWRRMTVTPVHLDGELVAAYVMVGVVPDDFEVMLVKGNVTARNRTLVDVTAMLFARWRDQDRLLSAATSDSLTGLANRDALSAALASAPESSALLYIDVDRFKAVNDRYGHDAGDRVLVEVSARIVAACRPHDVVARLGGDEFVVLLSDVGMETARQIGERIVATVGAPIGIADGPDRVEVSVGLAPLRHDRGDDVLADADRAMLSAKRCGRGRLVAIS